MTKDEHAPKMPNGLNEDGWFYRGKPPGAQWRFKVEHELDWQCDFIVTEYRMIAKDGTEVNLTMERRIANDEEVTMWKVIQEKTADGEKERSQRADRTDQAQGAHQDSKT